MTLQTRWQKTTTRMRKKAALPWQRKPLAKGVRERTNREKTLEMTSVFLFYYLKCSLIRVSNIKMIIFLFIVRLYHKRKCRAHSLIFVSPHVTQLYSIVQSNHWLKLLQSCFFCVQFVIRIQEKSKKKTKSQTLI